MVENVLDLSARRHAATSNENRLILENARLRRICAQAKEVASRHAILLREGDHRIKNSLQIVASLMNMQASRSDDGAVRSALLAASARVQSIARIHDALQTAEGKDEVDLGAAIETMCKALHQMASDPQKISVEVHAEHIETSVAIAQPIVLAVNELVVNALRHAFPNDRGGIVRIDIRRSGENIVVVVADDGQGMPLNHVEGKGYGMKLVRMMAAQIGGSLEMRDQSGVRYELTIPEQKSAA